MRTLAKFYRSVGEMSDALAAAETVENTLRVMYKLSHGIDME